MFFQIIGGLILAVPPLFLSQAVAAQPVVVQPVSQLPPWFGNENLSQSILSCPSSGSSLLPDNFPVVAQIITDGRADDGYYDPAECAYPKSVVDLIYTHAGSLSPEVFFVGTNTCYISIIDHLKIAHPGSEKWVTHISISGEGSILWLQDLLIATNPTQTGLPSLRSTNYDSSINYDSSNDGGTDTFGAIAASVTQRLPFVQLGIPLPSDNGQLDVNPYTGGNIQALPGGLCIHGSAQKWVGFADSYCGAEENEVAIDTSWLLVGHADEVVAVLPRKARPNEDPSCAFEIALASPQAAFDLLLKHKDETVFHFSLVAKNAIAPRGSRIDTFETICQSGQDCPTQIEQLTGAELVKRLKQVPQASSLNQRAQLAMTEAAEKIRATLRKRLPQCHPHLLQVPVLFTVSHGEGYAGDTALYTNPINSLRLQDGTIVASDPSSALLRKGVNDVLEPVGLHAEFVESAAVLYGLGGDIHCSTHSIRVCRPE